MKNLLFTILLLFVFSCKNSHLKTSQENATLQIDQTEPISMNGYWQIPEKSRFIKVGNEMLSNGNHLFFYDSNYVIISLLTDKAWMWKSEDDYYKLKAKFQHDSLFYLPPFGVWTFLAKFDGEKFNVSVQDKIFSYAKIKAAEINQLDNAILKPRDLHDYSIKPTDKQN